MKYRFITTFHNLRLKSIKNKGKEIFAGARISNGETIFSETVMNELTMATMGVHSIEEFKDSTYFYIDGEFVDIQTQEDMDKKGVEYTFLFLRQAQFFVDKLWEVKDNNVYVRDGFLIAYSNEFDDGFTYKASLSEIFSLSSNERRESVFSDEELQQAIENYNPIDFDYFDGRSFGGKYPPSDYFFKSKGSTRMQRAMYFVKAARSSSILPMKIVSYCTALECLFTIGTSEINHKIAERVALLLGGTPKEKKEIFGIIKEGYKYRSTLVHGQHLKVTDEHLTVISVNLDNYLREFIKNNTEIFEKNDLEMEEYFLGRLFE
ncbi:HEPN domain-containing protein [Ureibacillus chungkukjangi]|uniref:Uncharacterized protein n=1 Tax=Ureibacillus chungkukjangi TaxID=1202712 RepID=A0A318TQ44_9BACL|nr:HEPN domain-containing protein [Ureibacillus chungkukjangi]PYF01759.1 hypothetical protein BJ095_1591 [Ureibacillus chungkukjangi]